MDDGADDLFCFPRQEPDCSKDRAKAVLPYISFQLVTEIIQNDLTILLGSGFRNPFQTFLPRSVVPNLGFLL